MLTKQYLTFPSLPLQVFIIDDGPGSVVLLDVPGVGHGHGPSDEPGHLPGPVPRSVHRHSLTNMVEVFHITNLEIMRESHQMQNLSQVQEPVLTGVDGRHDVLLDDGSEAVPHELDGVVPVALAHLQLGPDVCQSLNMSPTFTSLIQTEFVTWVILLKPVNTLVN